MRINRKQQIRFDGRFIRFICFLFLISLNYLFVIADDNIPPLIKRPDNTNAKQQSIIAEVVAVETRGSSSINNDKGGSNNTEVLEGNDALSFIVEKLGIKDYELVFQDKQTFTTDTMKEFSFRIKEGLDYYVTPKEVLPPGLYTLDTRVQITEGGKVTDAIKAVAKAKLGEPLVYKGIEADNTNYIIICTLKSEDENQSQSGEQNKEQEQKESEQDKQNTEEQQKQSEQKDNEENKKENRQIQLLLESLEEMDQKEQKEMLNERERIMLPEKWW